MLIHSRVYIDAIVVGERKRPVDDDKVAILAKSMETIGLQQPISIWAEKDEIEGAPDTLHLVAGLHRLRAAEKLGWEQIDAVYVDLSDIDRRRWEIAENLHRSELTALERDQHVAEWIRLTEEAEKKQEDISSQNETKLGRRSSGVNKAAKELNIPGKTERAKQVNAHRAVKVASLTEEAKETAREVGLDKNRSALLTAASKPKEQQAATLREIAQQKAHQREQPKPKSDGTSIPADEPFSLDEIREMCELDAPAVSHILHKLRDLGWSAARKTLSSFAVAA